jgi:hypothetical protein
MLMVVKIILLIMGLALAGMVIGYRRLLKALVAVGIGALMLYGLVLGVWLYAEGPSYAWRLAGGVLMAAVAGAVAGLAAGRRTGFTVFGLVFTVACAALLLACLL